MRELYTEITIASTPEKIWQHLMDFESYTDWNPFILQISGNKKIRSKLNVIIKPANGSAMQFKPTVTKYEKNHHFAWLGQLWMSGIFDGHHEFIIVPVSDSECKFIQKEQFHGLLVPFLWKRLERDTKPGFMAMNTALKKLAEGLNSEADWVDYHP